MTLSTKEQWLWLKERWDNLDIDSIRLSIERIQPGVRVRETAQEAGILFELTRYFSGKRITEVDKLGFVGVTTTDLNNKTLLITEGISDFLSTKSQFLELNVWGKTKLGLSYLQIHAIKSMFNKVLFIADNDTTGIKKAFEAQSKLTRAGVKSDIFLPRNKDITLDIYQGLIPKFNL